MSSATSAMRSNPAAFPTASFATVRRVVIQQIRRIAGARRQFWLAIFLLSTGALANVLVPRQLGKIVDEVVADDGSITMIAMCSYVIARMDFRGKKVISAMIYSTLFIPPTAMTFPVYNLVNNLGLYNTPYALIFVYSCSGIAMSFFIIKNYFAIIPKDLEEAAEIDGATYAQTFWKVMLPIARPGIVTAAVLQFMNHWNEYYWSSMLVMNQEELTVPALLGQFTTSFNTNYTGLYSAIAVIVLPPIILFAFTSKYFVEALGGGAVKG